MKIQYLQQGSRALTLPFAVYQAPDYKTKKTATTQAAAAAKKDVNGADIKEIYKMFNNIPGLPGDRYAVASTLNSLLSNMEYKLSNPELFGGTSSIASDYLQALNHLSNLKFYHDEYLKARDTATQKNSLYEVAINPEGKIMAQTSDGYDWIDPATYIKNQKSYRPITNAELLQMRARGEGGLAYNLDSINVVAGSVSMTSITNKLNDIVKDLKAETLHKEGYSAHQGKQVIEGIGILQQAAQMGALDQEGLNGYIMDGIYKNDVFTESQKRNAVLAYDYLMRSLTTGELALLKLKTDGTDKGAAQLMLNMVNARAGHKVEFKTDYQKDLNIDGSKKDSSTNKVSDALRLQLDQGSEIFAPVNSGTASGLMIRATMLPNTDSSGNTLINLTLQEMLSKSKFGILANGATVSMGDKVLDESSFNNIIITTNRVHKMYLPVDQAKRESDGTIVPDTKYLEKMDKAWKEIKKEKINMDNPSKEDIVKVNAIFKNNGFTHDYLLPNGQVNQNIYMPFMTFNAVAWNKAFDQGTVFDTKNFREVIDPNSIDSYWKMLKGKDTKEEFDKRDLPLERDFDQFLRGQIYISMSIDPLVGVSGETPISTIRDYQQKFQEQQRANSVQLMGK